MFGHRNDAKNVSNKIDTIVLFTPLIMPTRCESMNLITYPAEYEPLANYIRQKHVKGEGTSFLTILAAAYVRAVKYYPYLNYFVMGHRVYEHEDISISLAIVRSKNGGGSAEELVKIHATPDDTLGMITEKFNAAIADAKNPDTAGGTLDFAGKLLRIPVLPSVVVALARVMDRFGILPKSLIEISPFHCSLFITNMMSIGLPALHHHLYNFGTNSIFLSLGKPEKQIVIEDGKAVRKPYIPLGIVTDERICDGADYAAAAHRMTTYLKMPELLDMTPEEEQKYLEEHGEV